MLGVFHQEVSVLSILLISRPIFYIQNGYFIKTEFFRVNTCCMCYHSFYNDNINALFRSISFHRPIKLLPTGNWRLNKIALVVLKRLHNKQLNFHVAKISNIHVYLQRRFLFLSFNFSYLLVVFLKTDLHVFSNFSIGLFCFTSEQQECFLEPVQLVYMQNEKHY